MISGLAEFFMFKKPNHSAVVKDVYTPLRFVDAFLDFAES